MPFRRSPKLSYSPTRSGEGVKGSIRAPSGQTAARADARYGAGVIVTVPTALPDGLSVAV